MKAILFDMDGVIYNSETLIEGAPEALAWVRSRGIPHLFVTNTTSRSRSILAEKLTRFGIPADQENILTPCVAARQYLRDGGAVALFVPSKARSEFDGLPCLDDDIEAGARWVVVGDLGNGWSFGTLNRAFRLLQSNPEATLVALGMTRFWQAEDGPRLDTGPFAAALECATGKKALVVGKPAAAFFHAAAEKLGVDVSDVVMLGDDVGVDVGGAQAAGLKGVLVRTGKFRPADLEGAVTPDAVLDSIVDLPDWWKQVSPPAAR
jgi:phospholysine phosphohistidine inorganic pyrophosphate phosphatase